MSEQGPHSSDPNDPTEIDAKAAFAMGADSSNPSQFGDWTPPEPAELDPLFPNYDVEVLVGRGGMGAVYKAVQKNLDRTVAIKLLPAEMAQSDPSFAERFKREAKAMAALDHPNIVTVHDFGETLAGHYYFVMEYVDGMDFHQLIHSGQLDAVGALNAVSQICDALEYAHHQGYVHRDIKPANVFINQAGILKVGDFGLAKIVVGDEPVSSVKEPHLTQSGVSMGTPIYSAPEQMDGRPVDQRADIYSLGVMFYEMLTHELPRGHFPPPSQKVEVDVRLDQVVLRAMESEPKRRYPSAAEMRDDVDVVRSSGFPEERTDQGEPIGEAQPLRPGIKLWVSIAVLLAVTVLAVLFQPWKVQPDEPIISRSIEAEPTLVDQVPHYSWKGRNVALETRGKDWDPAMMRRVLNQLDQGYDQWCWYFGQDPREKLGHLMTIRESVETSSAQRMIGAVSGVVLYPKAASILESYERDGTLPWFWFQWGTFVFDDIGRRIVRIDGPSDRVGQISTCLRTITMDKLKQPASGETEYHSLERVRTVSLEALERWEEADSSFGWNHLQAAKTLKVSESDEVKSGEAIRGILYRLSDELGEDVLRRWLAYEVMLRPIALNNQMADDNFVISLSRAANENLALKFETDWRWTVSMEAKNELKVYFSAREANEERLLSKLLDSEEVVLLPNDQFDQSAIDRLFIDESRAASQDLASLLIERLDWPVSETAQTLVREQLMRRVDGLVADDRWRDLLPQLIEGRGISTGGWRVEGNQYTYGEQQNLSAIGVPTEPVAELDLRIRLTRQHGTANRFRVTFPCGEGLGQLVFNLEKNQVGLDRYLGEEGAGIGSVNGILSELIPPEVEKELFLQIRSGRINVFIDEQVVYSNPEVVWTDYVPHPDFRQRTTLSVASQGVPMALHSFEARIPSRVNPISLSLSDEHLATAGLAELAGAAPTWLEEWDEPDRPIPNSNRVIKDGRFAINNNSGTQLWNRAKIKLGFVEATGRIMTEQSGAAWVMNFAAPGSDKEKNPGIQIKVCGDGRIEYRSNAFQKTDHITPVTLSQIDPATVGEFNRLGLLFLPDGFQVFWNGEPASEVLPFGFSLSEGPVSIGASGKGLVEIERIALWKAE